MNLTIFIFFNIIIAACFIYSYKRLEIGYILKGISGLFSLFLLLGLIGGVSGSFDNGCEIIINETEYIYGNNFSDYHWEYQPTYPPATDEGVYLFHVENKGYMTACKENNNAFGSVLNTALILFYASLTIGLFSMASVENSEREFRGGFK